MSRAGGFTVFLVEHWVPRSLGHGVDALAPSSSDKTKPKISARRTTTLQAALRTASGRGGRMPAAENMREKRSESSRSQKHVDALSDAQDRKSVVSVA